MFLSRKMFQSIIIIELAEFVVLKVCMYFRWRSSYQEGRVRIPLTGLTPPALCTCPKPGLGFPTSYAVAFLVLNEFR